MLQQQKTYVITPEAFFNREERKQILKTCKELAELDLLKGRKSWPVRYMLIDLVMYSGLRVAEIASLKIRDLELKAKDPYLIVQRGKGGKKRTVYIDTELRNHLQRFLEYKAKSLSQSVEPEAPLFSGRNAGHSPPITLMKSFKVAVNRSSLRNNLSIHSARHTYATFLYKDTNDLRYVQKQLGHSNISMTAIYADILPEDNGRLANMITRD